MTGRKLDGTQLALRVFEIFKALPYESLCLRDLGHFLCVAGFQRVAAYRIDCVVAYLLHNALLNITTRHLSSGDVRHFTMSSFGHTVSEVGSPDYVLRLFEFSDMVKAHHPEYFASAVAGLTGSSRN